jgi:lipopolysaccharide export system protein LptA
MKKLTFMIMIVIISTWLLTHLASAQIAGEFKGKQGPVHIAAQQLEADYQAKVITFIGGVVARQQEFTLYADRLFLFIDEKGEDIEKIVARGNVRLVQGKRKATCREATYYHREGTVVLRGEPVVREGENWVSGKRIIYYIHEQKSVAEGEGEDRVRVTIIPHEEKQ